MRYLLDHRPQLHLLRLDIFETLKGGRNLFAWPGHLSELASLLAETWNPLNHIDILVIHRGDSGERLRELIASNSC